MSGPPDANFGVRPPNFQRPQGVPRNNTRAGVSAGVSRQGVNAPPPNLGGSGYNIDLKGHPQQFGGGHPQQFGGHPQQFGGHPQQFGGPAPPFSAGLPRVGDNSNDMRTQLIQAVANDGGNKAMFYAKKTAVALNEYIQRGPQGISVLCFLGGMMTTVFGVVAAINPFGVLEHPLNYMLNAFFVYFGLATCVLEASPEWVAQIQKLRSTQEMIHEYAKFLSTLGGRGLFYIFQATLSVGYDSMGFLGSLLAAYMVFMGFLCILMQCGFNPDLSCLFNLIRSQPTNNNINDNYIQVQ